MLKFEVDSLDSVDEGLRGLYVEHEGVFRLGVEGIDPADELKNALKKERELSKDAAGKLKELEALKEAAEKQAMEEQGKFKELSERERKEKLETQAKLDELTKKIANSKRDTLVRDLAAKMTSDATEQKIISRFALDFVSIEGDEATFSKDIKEIESELSQFVFNKSTGSNDGGNGGKGGQSLDLSKMNSTEMMKHGRATKK
jgi:hypothetical protein